MIKAESDARARDMVTDNSKGNKKVVPQTTQTSSNVGAANSQASEGISAYGPGLKAWAQASVEAERDEPKAKDTARARDETEVKDEAQPRIKAGSDAGARDMVTDNSKGNKKVVPQTTQTSSNVRTANPQVSEGISAYGPGLKAWAAQASVEAERHDSKAKNTTRARDETEVKDEAKPRIKAGSDTRARDMVTDTGIKHSRICTVAGRTYAQNQAPGSQRPPRMPLCLVRFGDQSFPLLPQAKVTKQGSFS
ncbi:hypothetical protein BC835DRAFT_1026957 [Cytidiella melzeri]|nr:hypothetical protein BC835DRAFT_1026957 [Cytidiella melzeri]